MKLDLPFGDLQVHEQQLAICTLGAQNVICQPC